MQDVEGDVAEKRNTKHGNRCENRAKNLSAVNLRPAERAKQANYQQSKTNSKERKICPWKITCNWKLGEEFIGEQSGGRESEADPDRPVPFSFHCARAGAIRRIQRYNPIAIAAKPSPPRILPVSSNSGPTSASGALLPENTIIAEITTPIIPSPTIKPDASRTPSCFAASGLAVRSARLSNNQPATAPTTTIKVLPVGK